MWQTPFLSPGQAICTKRIHFVYHGTALSVFSVSGTEFGLQCVEARQKLSRRCSEENFLFNMTCMQGRLNTHRRPGRSPRTGKFRGKSQKAGMKYFNSSQNWQTSLVLRLFYIVNVQLRRWVFDVGRERGEETERAASPNFA